jgi:hypothetical protein
MMSNETCRKHYEEKSVLYGREKDYCERVDASFGWLFPAESISLY